MPLQDSISAIHDYMNKSNDLGLEQFNREKMFQGEVNRGLKGALSGTDSLSRSLSPYLSGHQGFAPGVLQALLGGTMDQQSGLFNSELGNLKQNLVRRGAAGGDMPIGGDFARLLGSLYSANAGQLAQGLRNVNIANGQQGISNMFNAFGALNNRQMNAGNVISGLGAQNLQGQAGAFGREGDQLGNLLKADIAKKQMGFGQMLGNALTGQLSKMIGGAAGGLGDYLSGGMSSMMSGGGVSPGMSTGGTSGAFNNAVTSLPTQGSSGGFGAGGWGNLNSLLAGPTPPGS